MKRSWLWVGVLLVAACSPLAGPPTSTFTPSAPPPRPAVTEPPEATLPPMPETPAVEETQLEPTSMPKVRMLPEAAGFTWVLVVDGLRKPLDLQHAGDERVFLVEQRGVIHILRQGQLLDEPFIDLRDRVNSGASERGLLGLAFHPRYAENGFFYVNYTDSQGATVVARYQVSSDPDRADVGSERVLLRFEQPYSNHNGGGMAFGPDGYLYVATGDGGSRGDPQGNGQRLDTLLGKLLRLDVDGGDPYGIPADNPFAGGGGRPEIWAYGLRNPWRFAFDPLTGELYIADVGQNKWEEVDYLPGQAPGGVNFGWNVREGMHPYAGEETAGLTDPVVEYGRGDGCSVTGGVVVRSPSLPEWEGIYLYGDYCTGRMWGLLFDADGVWHNAALFETSFSITSYGVDASGEVYVVDQRGGIYRLERISTGPE